MQDDDWKNDMMKWLLKGLLIALLVIATSSGAAAFIKPILGL